MADFSLKAFPQDLTAVTAQKPGYFSQQELLRGGAPPVEVGPKSSLGDRETHA